MARVRHGVSNLVLSKQELLTATENRLWETLYKIDPSGDNLELGYQLTPNRAFLMSSWVKLISGEFKNSDGQRPLFTSGHQTWAGLRHMMKKGSTLPGKAMAIMPEQHSSIKIFSNMAKNLGTMPFVGYSGHKHQGRLVDYSQYPGFSTVGTQIVPEMPAAQNVSDGGRPYQLRKALESQKIDGLIVGTNHIMRKHDTTDARLNWERVLSAAQSSGTTILGAHAEYGRGDSSDPDDLARTRQELLAMANSPEAIGRTAIGNCLVMAYGIAQEQHTGPQSEFSFDVIHEVTNDMLRQEFPSHDPYDVIGGAVENLNGFLDSQFK